MNSLEPRSVRIAGAGPAGACAAIAAAMEGAAVEIADKSSFPRHKVCGEFFSPGVTPLLDALRVPFHGGGVAVIHRAAIHIGKRVKRGPLPETAFGLSRHAFDAMLHGRLRELDVTVRRGLMPDADILATGRRMDGAARTRGRRHFGFKAHFSGPRNDAVELYFFDDCYVGVCSIENGLTNVCGLGPEDRLKRFSFDFDALAASYAPLRERLAPLTRQFDWLAAGPLAYGSAVHAEAFAAGDALGFIDPFTGSGLLHAISTGAAAGRMAAKGRSAAEYGAYYKREFGGPFGISALLRRGASLRAARVLLPAAPIGLLFRATRPAASG